MSAPNSPPQVHGDGLTPPTEGEGATEAQGAAEGETLAKRLSRFGSSGYIRVGADGG